MQNHMRSLAHQHPQVIRMAVLAVFVAVVDDLTGLEEGYRTA